MISVPSERESQTVIVPSCSVIMRWLIAIPSPVPVGFVVKNGSKIFARCSGDSPGPLSTKLSCQAGLPLSVVRVHVTSMHTGSAQAASEFSKMLRKTCSSRLASTEQRADAPDFGRTNEILRFCRDQTRLSQVSSSISRRSCSVLCSLIGAA